MLEMLDAMDRIARLDDDVNVPAELAALYLCRSPKTLETWRRNGEGPPYCQPNVGDRGARNQKVSYRMSDLRLYRSQNTVTSTIESAVARGFAYATTGTATSMLIDSDVLLGTDWLRASASDTELREAVIPIWLDADNQILALVGECNAQENAAMLASGAIVEWAPAVSLRGRAWAPDARDCSRTIFLLVHLFTRNPR